MIKQHLHYTIPNNIDAPLWRYLDIKKLESLLRGNALYFRRGDRFADNHEGSYSDPAIADRPRFFEGAAAHFLEEGLPEMHQAWAKCTYINCWFVGEHESLAMWRLYGKVAIKSSIARLKEAIRSDKEFCLGLVNYINYEQDMMSQANAFSPFFHKQKAYEHEREFRILTFLGENINAAHQAGTNLDEGLLIPIEVEALVDSVVISPDVSQDEREKIEGLLKGYGLSTKVSLSSLTRKPRF